MKTRIVQIGNSQGIRIPKPLLEAAGLHGEVILTSRPGGLLIGRPAAREAVGTRRSGRWLSVRTTFCSPTSPTLSDWDEE